MQVSCLQNLHISLHTVLTQPPPQLLPLSSQKMFEAMDEDGDGTVDFHEFTIAMTGSAKSTVDSASEYDVDRLTKRFIEFANIRRREHALNAITTAITEDGIALESATEPETRVPGADSIDEEEQGSSQAKEERASFDVAKIDHFRTCFAVFNSRVTDESVENEIEAYYSAKGIKRHDKAEKKGTIGTTIARPMNATSSTVGPSSTTGLSVPDFRVRNTKTQEVLDLFLTHVSNFIETDESPAFRAKTKEQQAEDQEKANAEAEKEQLLRGGVLSHRPSPKAKQEEKKAAAADDDDVPIGIVVETLTPLQEREKREREFVEIQKRKAVARAKLAEEAMVDLDQIEENERLREERVYVLNIKKKPWVPKPATGGVLKWAGPTKVPTLVPLSTDQVLGKEMRMRVKTRRDIAALKVKQAADEKARNTHALSAHIEGLNSRQDYKDTFQSYASLGDESSTIFIDKPKPRKTPPAHGIVIHFAGKR